MIQEVPPPLSSDWSEPPPARRPKRCWRAKFREAFRGVKKGIRGHSSFAVHFFLAALSLAGAIVLEIDKIEWCLIIFCIGGVFTAELFNSAIETMFKGLDEAGRAKYYACLDIAAGAVLIASATAFIVGSIIFVHRFMVLARWT